VIDRVHLHDRLHLHDNEIFDYQIDSVLRVEMNPLADWILKEIAFPYANRATSDG
jgi:hypothetical protein